MLPLLMKNWRLRVCCSLIHVICKISNIKMWTTKHLAQAFCTELTLKWRTREQLFNHLSTYLGSQPCSTSCAVANDFWHANQKLKEFFDSTADQTTGLDCYVTCRNISINQTHSNILNTKLINHRQADEVKMHEIKRATACHYWNKKKWKY